VNEAAAPLTFVWLGTNLANKRPRRKTVANPAPTKGDWHKDLDRTGDLWQAIDNHFQTAADGAYYALKVTVKKGGASNPISGYTIVKDAAPGP
jgi:hypothetical protein